MSAFPFLRGLQFCLVPSRRRRTIITNKSDQVGKVSRHFFGLAVAAIAALFFATISSFAQQTTGSILGTLSDQSGAVIVNTTVTLTDIGTSVARTAITNQSGLYQFVAIPPSNYQITVQKQGYKQLIQGPIVLPVSSTLQVNLTLQTGSDVQQVTVTAQTPLVEAETTSLGSVIDQRETDQIPLNGRNPMNLVALVPSVVAGPQALGTPTGVNPNALGNYQIGGTFAGYSITYLDGAKLNQGASGGMMFFIPSQDSLSQFKVDTNNQSAEYGAFAGGVINFSTKSGTNTLHGGVWEYIRNRVLNANTYFGNQAGLPTPAFTQNQFGVNIGGPVYLPQDRKSVV